MLRVSDNAHARIPTCAAIPTCVTLRWRWALHAGSIYCATSDLRVRGFWGFAPDHVRGLAHHEISRNCATISQVLGNHGVFARGQPMLRVRRACGHVHDTRKMCHALQVATVMPSHPPCTLAARMRQDIHPRVGPARQGDSRQAARLSILHAWELVLTLERVAIAAHATLDLNQHAPENARACGDAICVTRHLAGLRDALHVGDCLFHGLEFHARYPFAFVHPIHAHHSLTVLARICRMPCHRPRISRASIARTHSARWHAARTLAGRCRRGNPRHAGNRLLGMLAVLS